MDFEEKSGVREFLKSPNHIIVILNVLIFLATDLFTPDDIGYGIILRFANYWPSVIGEGQYYRLLTCMFLHFDIKHIVGNMISILVLGDVLENYFGKIRYVVLYLSTGIVASVVSLFYYYKTATLSICAGASGAGFGLFGAMIAVLVLSGGKSSGFTLKRLLVYLVLILLNGIVSGGVDNAAHIGGLFAGMLIGFILVKTLNRKESPYED